LGATGERTDLNRGKLPSSYQVTLDGLRESDGDTTLESQTNESTFGIESAAAFPSLSPQPDNTHRTMTLSSGMTPERRLPFHVEPILVG
jgi:hypothetical protein